ncbi:DUF2922 domain-containing protein [Enterococcus sp. 669A]|uniref:DUF2922 domain-containing protein n=1 Tax=Candidatus Enterococcus moelleringii TaxID=2815325 RepID=A0ABS3LHV7_9ENTE|nr:DUF2922 domain-containing protein [Enterococcus sp. 669A]MBO1308296.1 DUF2922 domain-containing protein [Enterococcus sp. 669A]
MIKLVSTFLNSEGNKHTLNVKDPNTEKSPEEIKEALELLTILDIFEKDGVGLFQEVVSAKYVETIETPIFNEEKLFGEPDESIAFNQASLQLPWQKLPTAPVMAELPANYLIQINLPEQRTFLEQQTKYSSHEPQVEVTEPSIKRIKSYNRIRELAQRKIRRTLKERQRKSPPDPPIH